jgi:hypothetical protein
MPPRRLPADRAGDPEPMEQYAQEQDLQAASKIERCQKKNRLEPGLRGSSTKGHVAPIPDNQTDTVLRKIAKLESESASLPPPPWDTGLSTRMCEGLKSTALDSGFREP